VQDLKQTPGLHYLHFLGGETVITPGFQTILEALVDRGVASQVAIGFTTNLTVWSDHVVELLCKFKEVNLGLSIDSLTHINDYVRYPSRINKVNGLLDQWVQLGQQQNWITQLRITPTCLTVHDLDTVYQYAWENKLSIESCNFINNPEFFRIGVLPAEQRRAVSEKLQHWIDLHPIESMSQIINTRDPSVAHNQIIQDAQSYVDYLDTSEDESYRLPDLISYLKRLESNRGNSILTYLPQYENLFRSAGY